MGRPRSKVCVKGHAKVGDNLLITTENRHGKAYTVHLCKACTYANHNEWRRNIRGMEGRNRPVPPEGPYQRIS